MCNQAHSELLPDECLARWQQSPHSSRTASSTHLFPDGRSGTPPFSFSLEVRISTMTVLLSVATASRAAAGLISPAYPLKAPMKPFKQGGPCTKNVLFSYGTCVKALLHLTLCKDCQQQQLMLSNHSFRAYFRASLQTCMLLLCVKKKRCTIAGEQSNGTSNIAL